MTRMRAERAIAKGADPSDPKFTTHSNRHLFADHRTRNRGDNVIL
jgi:hypothetical protein